MGDAIGLLDFLSDLWPVNHAVIKLFYRSNVIPTDTALHTMSKGVYITACTTV